MLGDAWHIMAFTVNEIICDFYDKVSIEALRCILVKLLSFKEKISFRHAGKKHMWLIRKKIVLSAFQHFMPEA